MKRAFLVVVGTFVVACGSSSAPQVGATIDGEVGQVSQPIIGGQLNHGDPAVGYMSAQSGNTGWGCSGTLITPTVFLTAAHCVEDRTSATKFKVTFVHNQSQAATADWHAVKAAHHDPLFMAPGKYINDGHDCAVLILENPITSVAPIPINRTPVDSSWHGKNIRLVGYGNDNGRAGTGSGVKRQVTVPLANHRDGVLETNTPGRTTCQGDSGGPGMMMVNGVETVVSITSYGEQYCPGSAGLSNLQMCLPFVDQFIGGSCTPACDGRTCGGDGCGGSCGACPSGESCSAGGTCEPGACVPQCSGKTCGADGCGGSCGTCAAGSTCNAKGTCDAPPPATCGNGAASESEANDTSDTANALSGTMCGSLSSSDYVDWYTWYAGSSGVPYTTRVTTTGDATMAVWKKVDGQWYAVANTGDNVISRTGNGPGQYVIAVYSSARHAQSYTISLSH